MEFEILQAISQVGFPIAVASYSLVVLNRTIQENTKVLVRLEEKIAGGD